MSRAGFELDQLASLMTSARAWLPTPFCPVPPRPSEAVASGVSPEEAAGMGSPAPAQAPGGSPPGWAEQGPSGPAAGEEPAWQGTASPRGAQELPSSPAGPEQHPEGASSAPVAAAATQGSPEKEGSLETPRVPPHPEPRPKRRRRQRRRGREEPRDQVLSCHFPKKLWSIVSSGWFQSIHWAEDGSCICIDKQLFQHEVLDQQGPGRLFHTRSIKSFQRQLNLYGFTQVHAQTDLHACLIAREALRHYNVSRIPFYENPAFKRDNPSLLKHMRRRVRRGPSLCLDSAWNYQRSSAAAPPALGPAVSWQQHLPSAQQSPPGPPTSPQGSPAAGLQEPNSCLVAPGAAQLGTAHESSLPFGSAAAQAFEASSPGGQSVTLVIPYPVIVRRGQDPVWTVGPLISRQSQANGPEPVLTILLPVPILLPVMRLDVHLRPPQPDNSPR